MWEGAQTFSIVLKTQLQNVKEAGEVFCNFMLKENHIKSNSSLSQEFRKEERVIWARCPTSSQVCNR